MIVGEVFSWNARFFQWDIHDFLSHVRWKNASLRSPYFIFSEASYYLTFSCFRKYGRIQLNFRKTSDSPLRKLNVELGMWTGQGGLTENRRGEADAFGNFSVGTWMGCSEFFERRCEILEDGCLTVFCDLRRLDTEESASVLQLPTILGEEKVTIENEASEKDSDEEETGPEGKSLKRLQKDLKNLLTSGEDCDVTIKVQGKEFPAHRNFLRARSPVFKSMFSHEMVEKQSGVVVIDDCYPATFPDFLNYVYTGSIEHISDENVFSLCTAADKYGVEGLKEECVAFMKGNISVGTFCDTITLALRHTEEELIDLATEFFCSNLTEITKTVKWQTFLHENTTVGNELYIKAFSKII